MRRRKGGRREIASGTFTFWHFGTLPWPVHDSGSHLALLILRKNVKIDFQVKSLFNKRFFLYFCISKIILKIKLLKIKRQTFTDRKVTINPQLYFFYTLRKF